MRFRHWLPTALSACIVALAVPAAHSQGSIFDKLKAKAKQQVDQKEDQGASTAVNAADPTGSGGSSKAKPATSNAQPAAPGSPAKDTTAEGSGSVPATLSAYQHYDFVPGEKVLFVDDFATTPDGEFPSQWEMDKGQAVVDKQAGYEAFAITAGNYGTVNPRMKTKNYLPDQFTVECDYLSVPGAEPLRIFLDIRTTPRSW